jgi:hypothetical protein
VGICPPVADRSQRKLIMNHSNRRVISGFLFVVGWLSSASVAAESASIASQDSLLTRLAVPEAELATHRGQSGIDILQLNQMDLRAELHDNTLGFAVTGDNAINDDAFSHAQGHLSVIQNSGNHVIIQDAAIYNITIVH